MSKLYHASSSNSCKNLFFGTFFTNKSPNANQYANAGNTSNGRNKHSVSVAITNPIQIAILCYLFPYTGDDWAWGSKIGIDRLNNWFENYNGRYVGNLIVLAMTRSNPIQIAGIKKAYVAFFLLCVR